MALDIKARVSDWIFKAQRPETSPVLLHRRRIFILPTRQGLTFGFTLVLMLIGAINYNLSLGYVLIFLLGSMAMVSVLHTFRNIAHIELRPGRAASVAAGNVAEFEVIVENRQKFSRYSIALQYPDQAPLFTDVPAQQRIMIKLPVKTVKRGRLPLGRITVFTQFPLGLFYAWSYVELDLTCLVYPCPDSSILPPPTSLEHQGEGVEKGIGQDDFASLRPHHPSDSPRHVAWKAVARERGMLTKQFSGRADANRWLDWDTLPQLGVEARLSRLCRWVLDADAAGEHFGLRLPGLTVDPTHGDIHRRKCLEALALFGQEPVRGKRS